MTNESKTSSNLDQGEWRVLGGTGGAGGVGDIDWVRPQTTPLLLEDRGPTPLTHLVKPSHYQQYWREKYQDKVT